MGAATVKLRNPECLLGLNEETERQLPRVRFLRLIREDRYRGWLTFIAL